MKPDIKQEGHKQWGRNRAGEIIHNTFMYKRDNAEITLITLIVAVVVVAVVVVVVVKFVLLNEGSMSLLSLLILRI